MKSSKPVSIVRGLIAASFFVTAVGMTVGVVNSSQAKPTSAAVTTQKAVLSQVSDRKKVCMVNDSLFASDQIPVEVDGKMYYGCCEGCKLTLANEVPARFAKDPVSGKEVDKAVAVIGADPTGRVFYFENEANLKKFTP